MPKIALTAVFLFFLNTIVAQSKDSNLVITHLTGDFFIYTTYNLYQNYKVPANGMYLVTPDGVAMFDTPWDTTQFQPLLDSIQARHKKQVKFCISTHFHEDRTGGLAYYKRKGIKTYTTIKTDQLSQKGGYKRAEFLISKDTTFKMGNYSFETYYPGEGHAPDNIVIWFECEKILYGACLIKSTEDDHLGYLGDANEKEYATTVQNVQKKCQAPKHVIVGHGDWSDPKSLPHTLKMAKKLRRRSKRE